jgi:hypothetical protein
MASRQPSESSSVFMGIMVTTVVHIFLTGVLLFAALTSGSDDAAATEEMPVITMELLQWGEAMPNPNALPEIANPEEAPEDAVLPEPDPPPEETSLPQQEIVNLAQPPRENPEQRPEENRAVEQPQNPDAAPRTDRGETERRRPTNTTPIPGNPGGVIGGTSLSDSALARQLAGIVRQVNNEVRRPSTLTQAEWTSLWSLVHIRFTQEGQITRIVFRDGTENRAFRMAVTHGLNRFKDGSLRLQLSSVSDTQLRELLLQHGLGLYITPR